MNPFDLIGNLAGRVSGAIGGTLSQFVPSSTYINGVESKPSKAPKLVSPQYQPNLTRQVTGAAAPMPSAQPNLTGQITEPQSNFKFQMGLKDYKFVRPQLETLFNVKKKDNELRKQIDNIIKAGEKYGIDPRVLVSIANNESSLGENYPRDSFNPFGYLVMPENLPPAKNGWEKEQQIFQGLRGAGFTSLEHAIDALTGRFQRQPTAGYQQFYQDPTFSNLQSAYNANPDERQEQLANFAELEPYFR